jgi:hypothetical protein
MSQQVIQRPLSTLFTLADYFKVLVDGVHNFSPLLLCLCAAMQKPMLNISNPSALCY